MIDRHYIGHAFSPRTVAVEAGRLQFFADVIGETNPIHGDDKAAKEAGFSAPPALPTFLFCLEMDTKVPLEVLEILKVDIGRVLHGEQSFTYHAAAVAGDTVTIKSRITDIYDKKGGALEFFVLDSEIRNQDDIMLAELRQVIAVRN